MADQRFTLAPNNLTYFEERARREWAATEATDNPIMASAHRLLAIQYEADANELRKQLARN